MNITCAFRESFFKVSLTTFAIISWVSRSVRTTSSTLIISCTGLAFKMAFSTTTRIVIIALYTPAISCSFILYQSIL